MDNLENTEKKQRNKCQAAVDFNKIDTYFLPLIFNSLAPSRYLIVPILGGSEAGVVVTTDYRLK